VQRTDDIGDNNPRGMPSGKNPRICTIPTGVARRGWCPATRLKLYLQ